MVKSQQNYTGAQGKFFIVHVFRTGVTGRVGSTLYYLIYGHMTQYIHHHFRKFSWIRGVPLNIIIT